MKIYNCVLHKFHTNIMRLEPMSRVEKQTEWKMQQCNADNSMLLSGFGYVDIDVQCIRLLT